ncbi:histone deacetylase HDT2-like isoform X2 [Solanum dulcamara]|uniref:histone deacetylase HDT2-like isoform X1 n=1 Tax=Solanum dulcamara TaxID=45834 RepID=UPI002484EC61|nr:histone deacetylase HDT2-like isoform X1 [Solanum dulcamara]XP_055834558.1 histone deacetylase HDT2-like isoform X2 [Solanum dulcamara]
MEFWGVEVKAGESLKVKPELFKLIHVSQAAIGEVKDVKEAKHVPLRLTVGENSYVIGTLSAEDRPQLMFDLVFEKEFELSHGWKNGSVFFIGYTADDPSTDEIDSGDDVFSDEENVLEALNGKHEADVKDVKPDAKKSALVKDEKNAKVAEPKKKAESEDDDDSEDDSDDEDDSEDDSEDVPLGMDGPEGMDFSDGSEDDSEEDDDSEEETPKKVEQKKRPAPSPKVAPGSGKKAKQATPDKKSGDKKGPATPFAKQNGKPAFNGNNKPKTQSPKSGGQFSGNKSNNKNFSGQKNFKGKQGRK